MARNPGRKRIVVRRKNPGPLGKARQITTHIHALKLTVRTKAIQGDTYEIRYRKRDDGLAYKHVFDDPPLMYLAEIEGFGKGIVIIPNDDDVPLWE